MNINDPLQQKLDAAIDAMEQRMQDVLREMISIKSISGNERPMVEMLERLCKSQGLVTDRFETDETALAKYPQSKLKHLPLKGRPTLVATLKGLGATMALNADPAKASRTLLFNAHTDVVGVPDESAWSHGAWSGDEAGGNIFGRGACDIKGSIASALWAMFAIKSIGHVGGDVMIEFIPGEEDCVGLGTLTSVVRGYQADACIVLEPTESLPRPASRGAVRFDITCKGKSVHGTVKWLGSDAILLSRKVLDSLEAMESEFNDRNADELFAAYPIARPITVDTVHAGQWQGMVADRATVGGYFELLPGDDLTRWKQAFSFRLLARLKELGEQNAEANIEIKFSEEYAGHRISVTGQDSPLLDCARNSLVDNHANPSDAPTQTASQPLTSLVWSGFNSGCEAGLRASMFGTPTLVWGPGSLAQAHRVDEFVEWAQVKQCARQFVRFILAWSRHG